MSSGLVATIPPPAHRAITTPDQQSHRRSPGLRLNFRKPRMSVPAIGPPADTATALVLVEIVAPPPTSSGMR